MHRPDPGRDWGTARWKSGPSRSALLRGLAAVLTVTALWAAPEGEILCGYRRWCQHRDALRRDPSVVRYYTFETVQDAASTVPNLAGAEGELSFVPYVEQRDAPAVSDLQVIEGRWPQKRAVRLDCGWFEGAGLDVQDQRVTIECWLRPAGVGSIRPAKRGDSGTLLSVSSGWNDGWRMIANWPRSTVSLSLGCPTPTAGVPTVHVSPVDEGAWHQLVFTWDGRAMRMYVDGALKAAEDYDGAYVPAHRRRTFRVGYADFGVGSTRADVDEIVVYNRVLDAAEIAAHANLDAALNRDLTACLVRGDRLRRARNLEGARKEYARILALADLPGFAPYANHRAMALLRIADLCRDQGDVQSALTHYAKLRETAAGLPQQYRLQAWFALADTLRDLKRYAEARQAYTAIRDHMTGKHEHYRILAMDRLRDLEGLAEGAPLVDVRQRRIERISHPARTFYVATSGSDEAQGTEAAPFATLERARAAVQALKAIGPLPDGGVAVCLRAGVYARTNAFRLHEQDSGTPQAPVVYHAFPGEKVCITGGVRITGFAPVRDPAVLAVLPQEARTTVLQTDLKAQGITDFGQIRQRCWGRETVPAQLELVFDGRPMQLARWPNEGFAVIHDLTLTDKAEFRGDDIEKGGDFVYSGTRPERWVSEADGWLHGYWAVKYAAQFQKIKAIDPARHVISMHPPYPSYGIRQGWLYYALNLLRELDAPGEYYLDRGTGILYFWPPAPIEQGTALVSLQEQPMIEMKGAAHIVLRGLELSCTRGDAVTIENGTGNLLTSCTIGSIGNWAVLIKGGSNNAVVGCDIHDIGHGGIHLQGGDRPSLTPCGHLAENNVICRFSRWSRSYCPALLLDGVGCRASHNLLYDAPHNAIMARCNDHVIEYNEVHDVCYEGSEMGAFYTWAGKDSLSWRGTLLRYNYFHHQRMERYPAPVHPHAYSGGVGIHIDAVNGALTLYGNIFSNLARNAISNGGGRDNIFENNLFCRCGLGIMLGDRSSLYPYFGKSPDTRNHMGEALKRLPFQSPPWSIRYPLLAGILDDDPGLPKHNIVTRNVSYGGPWLRCHGTARELATIHDNWDRGDPGLVDAANGDLRLREDAPVFGEIGFERIPVAEIGLYRDELRASWPVEHPAGIYQSKTAARERTHVPTCTAWRRAAHITVDGRLEPDEWFGLDPEKSIVLEQDPRGKHGANPVSRAWVAYDQESLYIAVRNDVVAEHPLEAGTRWGQADSVEVVIEGQTGVNTQGWWVAENPTGPTFFLIGNIEGQHDSLTAAGVPESAALRLKAVARYAAAAADRTQWCCEWKIPFAEACIDPRQPGARPFNIGVRKTAGPASVSKWTPGKGPAGWVVWVGTGNQNWQLWNAGQLLFDK